MSFVWRNTLQSLQYQSSWWLFAQFRRGMTTPLFQTCQKSRQILKTTKVSLRKWLSNFELLWPPGDFTFSISTLEACPLENRPYSFHNHYEKEHRSLLVSSSLKLALVSNYLAFYLQLNTAGNGITNIRSSLK